LPFFGQNCSLPFSFRSLDIPALLKSWQKHYQGSLSCTILSQKNTFSSLLKILHPSLSTSQHPPLSILRISGVLSGRSLRHRTPKNQLKVAALHRCAVTGGASAKKH
jgi:hypothetical protein